MVGNYLNLTPLHSEWQKTPLDFGYFECIMVNAAFLTFLLYFRCHSQVSHKSKLLGLQIKLPDSSLEPSLKYLRYIRPKEESTFWDYKLSNTRVQTCVRPGPML